MQQHSPDTIARYVYHLLKRAKDQDHNLRTNTGAADIDSLVFWIAAVQPLEHLQVTQPGRVCEEDATKKLSLE